MGANVEQPGSAAVTEPIPATPLSWQALPRPHRQRYPLRAAGNRPATPTTDTNPVNLGPTRTHSGTAPVTELAPANPVFSKTPTQSPDAPSSTPADADRAIASTALRLIAEITCGLRPAHQSIRWTSATVYSWLGRAHTRAGAVAARSAAASAVAITGIHVQRKDDSIIECCATVLVRRANNVTRARALAVCLRKHRGTWWVTQVEW